MRSAMSRKSTRKNRLQHLWRITLCSLPVSGCILINYFVSAQAPDLTVTAICAASTTIGADEAISFQLSRPLQAAEGKLALMIGKIDFTAFCVVAEQSLSYTPKLVPLPPGESPVIVYLVSPTN